MQVIRRIQEVRRSHSTDIFLYSVNIENDEKLENFSLTKTIKTLSTALMLLWSLCAKRYVLVFKSKLLRQCHTTFHIHFVSQVLERKTRFSEPKNLSQRR